MLQVVDAIFYDLVDKGKHLYILRETTVTVPTHMILFHGFELQSLTVGKRSSKELKALARNHAKVLNDDDLKTIRGSLTCMQSR